MSDRPDPLPHLAAAAAGVAAAGQPDASLAALDRAMAAAVGHKLFTVLVINEAMGQNQRYYSNRPDAYPVGGHKPMHREGPYYDQVVVAGRPRFLHDRTGIVAAFPDHELILSLGCEGAVNVPVRWNGQTLGGVNLLHRAGWYREEDAPLLLSFAALAVPALLDIVRRW
ncbi:GAF domain-containing protein [Muricoccus radiodurans]|uniref:GAF domain-containing protein n=1 Tax=Muricoccus radiodurans TaxID=2231721 RepID=UPI003CED8C0E